MTNSNTLPFVIAHRGASGTAPENTRSAIQKAANSGCTWIEVDGTSTADGQAVLHHDDDIDRCSDGSGLLLAKNLAKLQQLDFGAWFSSEYEGEPILTLSQCAKLCNELSLGCNMEIKVVDGWEQPTAEVVCAAVRDHWPANVPVLFSSFSPEALIVAKSMQPDIARAYLATVIPRDWQQRLVDTESSAMHCADTCLLDEKSVHALNANGFAVRVYTVDDPIRAAELKSWGVQSIFTNFPERMLHLSNHSQEHVK